MEGAWLCNNFLPKQLLEDGTSPFSLAFLMFPEKFRLNTFEIIEYYFLSKIQS